MENPLKLFTQKNYFRPYNIFMAELYNKELAKYIAELNEDTELSISSLREKSLQASSTKTKFLCYLFKEKENLERIKNAKAKILKEKMASNKVPESVLRLKTEDSLTKDDANIKKLNELFDITQVNIEYLERALNILNSFSFDIKNCIEILKIEKS